MTSEEFDQRLDDSFQSYYRKPATASVYTWDWTWTTSSRKLYARFHIETSNKSGAGSLFVPPTPSQTYEQWLAGLSPAAKGKAQRDKNKEFNDFLNRRGRKKK
jgi:hypothetical protein